MKDLNLVELPNFNDPEAAAFAWFKEYNAKNKALAELAILKRKTSDKVVIKSLNNGLCERLIALVENHNGLPIGVICNRLRSYKKQDIEQAINSLVDGGVFHIENRYSKANGRYFYFVFAAK